MRGAVKIAILILIIIFLLILVILIKTGRAEAQSTTTTILPARYEIVDSNTEQVCTGKTCTATVSASPQFMQDSNGTWKNITDVIGLSLTKDGLNISWDNNYVTLEPLINYSGTIYTWSDIPPLVKQKIANKVDVTKYRSHYKWAFNINLTNASVSIKGNISNIGFSLVANTTPISKASVGMIADRVSLDFSDVLQKFDIISLNKTQVWITNVSGLNEIYIDPTITTINASTNRSTFWAYSPSPNPAACGDPPIANLAEYSIANYNGVSASDNVYTSDSAGTGNCAYHLFNFTINNYSTLNWARFSIEAKKGGSTNCDSFGHTLVQNLTDNSFESTSITLDTSDTVFARNETAAWNFVNTSAANQIIFGIRCDGSGANTIDVDQAQLQYEYVPQNTAPAIQSASMNLLDWGASSDLRLLVNVTDADGQADISAVWINGTSIVNYSRIDTNFYVLDINASRAYTYYIYANDSANETVTANFSFAVSNATQNQTASFSKTMSEQVIELNNTLNMTGGTFSGFNYTINYTVPFPGVANLSPVNITGTVTPTANASFFTNWSSDWLTNSGQQNETSFQNRSRNSTLGAIYVINQTNISITNHANVTFTSIAIGNTCNNNNTAFTINSYVSNVYGNCTWTEFSFDWVVESGLQNETSFENRSRSQSLTSQYVINQTNASVRNSGNINFVDILMNTSGTVTLCPNNLSIGSINSGASVVQNNCTWTEFNVDNIAETEFANRTFQNRTQATHNQTVQYYINETYLNATNNWGVSFLNVSWSGCENVINGTVNTGTNQLTQNCSWVGYTADFVNESRARYNITDGNVTLNANSSGYIEYRIEILSTGFNLTNLTINATPLFPTFWDTASNSTENFSLDINVSQTTFINRSISTTRALIVNISTDSTVCASGMSQFNTHCRNSSTYSSGDTTFTLYDTITQLNISDSSVGGFDILLPYSISFYPDWELSSRTILENVRNSTSTNISISSNATTVVIDIGTDHSTSSVSILGPHTTRIKYRTSIQQQGGGGGGGGGGGAGLAQEIFQAIGVCGNNRCEPSENITNCALDCANVTWEMLPPSFFQIGEKGQDLTCFGSTSGCDILINNFEEIPLNLTIYVEDGGDNSYQWTFFTNEFGSLKSRINVNVPAGNEAFPGKKTVNLKITIPTNANDGVYTFNIVSERGVSRQVVPFKLQIGKGIQLAVGEGIIGFLTTPILNVERIPILSIFFVPGLYIISIPLIWIFLRLTTPRRRSR